MWIIFFLKRSAFVLDLFLRCNSRRCGGLGNDAGIVLLCKTARFPGGVGEASWPAPADMHGMVRSSYDVPVSDSITSPDVFAPTGLTYDDVLLLPG